MIKHHVFNIICKLSVESLNENRKFPQNKNKCISKNLKRKEAHFFYSSKDGIHKIFVLQGYMVTNSAINRLEKKIICVWPEY